MIETPITQHTSGTRSRRLNGSRSQTAPIKNTHQGAVFCSQIALAAVVSDIAVRYSPLMQPNEIAIGSIDQRQLRRRTNGRIKMLANTARQNAICTPRDSAGQESNSVSLAKNPLVLHKMAATSTARRASIRSLAA